MFPIKGTFGEIRKVKNMGLGVANILPINIHPGMLHLMLKMKFIL